MKGKSWVKVIDEFSLPPEDPGAEGHAEGELFPVRVVLFDVYGTLVKPLIGDLEAQLRDKITVESFEETLRWFGLKPDMGKELYGRFFAKVAEYHETMKNLGIIQPEVLIEYIWMELLAEKGIEVGIDDARAMAVYREMKANPVAAFRGVSECIEKLTGQNIAVGIVSNSQFYTMPILKNTLKIDLDKAFSKRYLFLSYELGFAKPDPHFFLVARTRLAIDGIRSGEVAVVGNDWHNDVVASKKFGFQAIFFRGEGREQGYNPEDIGMGTAIAYNYEQVEKLLGIGG